MYGNSSAKFKSLRKDRVFCWMVATRKTTCGICSSCHWRAAQAGSRDQSRTSLQTSLSTTWGSSACSKTQLSHSIQLAHPHTQGLHPPPHPYLHCPASASPFTTCEGLFHPLINPPETSHTLVKLVRDCVRLLSRLSPPPTILVYLSLRKFHILWQQNHLRKVQKIFSSADKPDLEL